MNLRLRTNDAKSRDASSHVCNVKLGSFGRKENSVENRRVNFQSDATCGYIVGYQRLIIRALPYIKEGNYGVGVNKAGISLDLRQIERTRRLNAPHHSWRWRKKETPDENLHTWLYMTRR